MFPPLGPHTPCFFVKYCGFRATLSVVDCSDPDPLKPWFKVAVAFDPEKRYKAAPWHGLWSSWSVAV